MTASAHLIARERRGQRKSEDRLYRFRSAPAARAGAGGRFHQTVAVLSRPGKVAEHPPAVAVDPARLLGNSGYFTQAGA